MIELFQKSLYSALEMGAFLFFLYVIAQNLCHRFIPACYDYSQKVTMTQLDVNSLDVSIPPISLPDPKTAHRLIVLVPEFDADSILIARKVRELAYRFESRVQLIGLSPDAFHEQGLYRQLITLSAHIEDAHIFVETEVEVGRSWLKAIQPYWREGDLIVCFSEAGLGNKDRKLRQLLDSSFGASIYVISGFYAQKSNTSSFVSSDAFAWISSLVLIFSFFWLQIKLFPLLPSKWENIILYLSIFIETVSIWFLNSQN